MHARMTTIRTQPGKVAEAMDIARDSMTPHANEQQGFKGLIALTDPESDEVVFISLWDTEDDLEAGEDSGYYEEQIGKLSNILAGRTEREIFEAIILAQVKADSIGGRT
jgi:heme-degrading monooxygenase HmoA